MSAKPIFHSPSGEQVNWLQGAPRALTFRYAFICSKKTVWFPAVDRFVVGQKSFGAEGGLNHGLPAARTVVARVAGLHHRIARIRAFHIAAGQVIKHNVELGTEQLVTALVEMPFELGFGSPTCSG